METMKHWSDLYTREFVENSFGKLTDKQWDILYQEVEAYEDDEPIQDVIRYIVENISQFEQEHNWWNAKIK